MNKLRKSVIALAMLLLIVFGFTLLKSRSFSYKNQGTGLRQEAVANLKINIDGDFKSFDISPFVGRTALEATEAKTQLITNGEGVNAFVTSIDGRVSDSQKNEFWEFNVNGSQAQVGAGSYIIQNHDEIEWKISNF